MANSMLAHEKLQTSGKAVTVAALPFTLYSGWGKRHALVDHLARASESNCRHARTDATTSDKVTDKVTGKVTDKDDPEMSKLQAYLTPLRGTAPSTLKVARSKSETRRGAGHRQRKGLARATPTGQSPPQFVRDFLKNTLRRIAVCTCGLLVASIALNAPAQGPPVGSWDIVLSGKYQHGLAQIAFSADGTLSGIIAFTYFGRTLPHTNHGFMLTNVYGGANLDGQWVYDRPNHITGFINEISTTGGAQTNLNTNGLSFRAVVSPTRLSKLAFGP